MTLDHNRRIKIDDKEKGKEINLKERFKKKDKQSNVYSNYIN